MNQTKPKRLRAGILATKGTFNIVIAPSALENFICTFGVGILSACGAQNAAQTASLGGGAMSPIDPRVFGTVTNGVVQ